MSNPNHKIQKIVENAFNNNDYSEEDTQAVVEIKELTYQMCKVAFWAGYRECMKDMSREK